MNRLRVWRDGLALGASVAPREPVLGFKRLVLPVSYWRTAEFAFALRHLPAEPGARILDVGSPKELAVSIARRGDQQVVTTDILESEVTLARRYAAALGISMEAQREDGRGLSFPTGSFDAAFSISVVEHIPDAGDSQAIAELVRVVRPGGAVIVTTPFDVSYRETFVQGDVYERAAVEGGLTFYERHYDERTLRERLLSHPGATVESIEIWGEGRVRAERALTWLGPMRGALSPIEPLLSMMFLRRVEGSPPAHPMAAFFVLRKRSASDA